MKKSLVRRRSASRSGFTLVELLVVIGIIAILASVLMVAGGSAIKSAKRATASTLANSIQTAALNYYTEYGVYPVPTGTAGDYIIKDTDAASWKILICALCGNVSPVDGSAVPATTILNNRGIAFLSLKANDVDNAVGPKNPLPPDTAHLYFNIAMDNDYDGLLGGKTGSSIGLLPSFNPSTTGAPPPMTGFSTAGIAIWANCNGSKTSQNSNFWVHTY